MLTTTEDTLTAFPAPGTTICACDEDAACAFHAASLAPAKVCERCDHECDDATMGCDCGGIENWDGNVCCACKRADDARRTFEDASADFHIPGWTPEDADTREHDRKILADMTAEAHNNPDMAHALLTFYPDDAFTADDLAAMRKHDAKDWDAGEGEV